MVNFLVLMTLLFTTRHVAKMIYIPNRFLGAFIMILAFVGVYSIRNSLNDCISASIFGFVGYIMRRLDWPLVPVVLGLVLGSIIIERLTAGAGQVRSLVDLVNRPVSGTLAVAILVVIGVIFWSAFKGRRLEH